MKWKHRFEPVMLILGVLAGLWLGPVAKSPGVENQPMYLNESLTAEEMAEDAKSLLERGRPKDAVQTLHRLGQEHHSKLMPQGDGLYVDVAIRVRAILRSDKRLLKAYRRKYAAQARRQLDLASQNSPDLHALEMVFDQYRLTPSGLDAGLDLAALYLSRAQIEAAHGVLEHLAHHPDLKSNQGRYLMLQALAETLQDGDSQSAKESRDRLRTLGQRDRLQVIETLRASLRRPPLQSAGDWHGSEDQKQAEPPTNQSPSPIPDQPLWSLRFASPLAGPGLRSRQGKPLPPLKGNTRLKVLPTVSGNELFINSGQQILALDVHSGRPRWQFNVKTDAPGVNTRSAFASRMSRLIGDKRGVLVKRGGKRLYAVVGQVTTTPVRLNGGDAGATTALIALNRDNGSIRWRLAPGEIDPALAQADFRGTPRRQYGQLLVMLTRTQSAGSRDTFIAAVDARTGKPRWHRHIAGSRSTQRYSIGPAPRMIQHHGEVYISDSLGAVAAVDSRQGRVRWVRLLADSDSVDSRMVRALGGATAGPPDVSPPALIRAGLIVPLGDSRTAVTLLDPRTGELRRRFGAKPWTGERYLKAVQGDLLAIGKTTTRYDGQSLTPRWHKRLVGDSTGSQDSEDKSTFQPLGRPTVTSALVAIPGRERLLRLSMDDGHELPPIHLNDPGNTAVANDAIMLAAKLDLYQYGTWKDATHDLRHRIKTNPSDPEPGLGLAYLGLTAQRDEPDMAQTAIDGLNAAVQSIDRRSAKSPTPKATQSARQEVFDQINEFVDPSFPMSVQTRRKIFRLFAVVTTTPAQEVAYHLKYASFLRQEQVGQYARAVKHYQAVLSTPRLAGQDYHADGVKHQAGLEARRQLTALVNQQGRAVYQTYENQAHTRLRVLRQRQAKAEAFIQLANRYPLANSAARARFEAATALIERGEPIGAVGQLRRAYHQARATPLQARIVGRLAELYQRQNQPAKALRWLKRIKHKSPQLRPIRDGQATRLDPWIAKLAGSQVKHRPLAWLNPPLHKPRVVEGTLIRSGRASPSEHSADRYLVRDKNVVKLYRADSDHPVWKATLWGQDDESSHAMAGGVNAANARANPKRPAGGANAGRGRIIGQVGRARLRIIVAQGQAQAVGRLGPQAPQPQSPRSTSGSDDSLRSLALTPGRVVLWSPRRKRLFGLNGRTGQPIWPARSASAVLSQVTAADRLPINRGPVDVRIMDMFGGAGQSSADKEQGQRFFVKAGPTVICLADRQGRVVAIDQHTGQVLWRVRSPIGRLDRLVVGQNVVALTGKSETADEDDSSASLVVLDLITGTPHFAPVDLHDQSPVWMGLDDQDRLITAEDDSVVARKTDTGQVLWRKSIPDRNWSGKGWLDGKMLLLADQRGTLHGFDPSDGTRQQPLNPPSPVPGPNPLANLRLLDGNAFLLTAHDTSSYHPDGKMRWSDVLSPTSVTRIGQAVGRHHVWVLGQTSPDQQNQDDNDQNPSTLMLYCLDRQTGVLKDEYHLLRPKPSGTLTAPASPTCPTLIKNHVLLSIGDKTLIYPGAKQ